MQCPSCGFENRADARFCKRCGTHLPQEAPAVHEQERERTCPNCDAPLRSGARFCKRCGTQIEEEEPAVAPAAAPSRQEPEPTFAASPSPAPSVSAPPPSTPTPVPTRKAVPWLWEGLAFLLMGAVSCFGVFATALAPALSVSIPPPPEAAPQQEDLTIYVGERYLNEAVSGALPGTVPGQAHLDVRPGNQIVSTADFNLLLTTLQVLVTARIGVEDGEVAVWVESIEAGGSDILELLGVSAIEVGESITGSIAARIEEELGEGAQLLEITTSEEEVILKARWEP
ncbi:MAG: zinc ribbon domain-containing protein [Anaerolineales bacterium]